MADQAPEFDGRARADLAPGIFGMMAVLVAATVIAILYFAREVFVPITLAVLLSCGLGHRQTDGGRVLADQFPQATDHHRPSGNGGVHLRGCRNAEQRGSGYGHLGRSLLRRWREWHVVGPGFGRRTGPLHGIPGFHPEFRRVSRRRAGP